MKLLIAEDEALSREGLVSSIDWEKIGITEIFQADDGIRALQIARIQKPDIILSDIRMPRLNGIELVEQLTTLLPDASFIFMSGYSDKEYLKAAIKLKAVDYIEKPLNLAEVESTVLEAVRQHQKTLRSRQTEGLLSLEAASHLAFLLTKPYRDNRAEIQRLTDELSLPLSSRNCFITYLVKIKNTELSSAALKEIQADIEDFLQNFHLHSIYVRLHSTFHIFHIMGEDALSEAVLTPVETFLKEQFRPLGDYFISRGEMVAGISRVFQSYTSSVAAMQSSFFFTPGTIITTEASWLPTLDTSVYTQDETDRFYRALSDKNIHQCKKLLDAMYRRYRTQPFKLLPNQIKDLYYQLFLVLNDFRKKWKLPVEESVWGESSIEYLEKCFTYDELHTAFVSRLEYLFQKLNDHVPEDAIIFMIKDYVGKNYSSSSLSIKEISDHVFMSASYVCTYFKNQTGQTLNQYLTEYRMKKAMELLGDARYQIADISSKVGYSNGNYFGKSFKKYTGLTPSKYREKILG